MVVENEFLSYIWDFKKHISNFTDYIEEHFPEISSRVVSAWRVDGTSWEVKFKKVNKDEL